MHLRPPAAADQAASAIPGELPMSAPASVTVAIRAVTAADCTPCPHRRHPCKPIVLQGPSKAIFCGCVPMPITVVQCQKQLTIKYTLRRVLGSSDTEVGAAQQRGPHHSGGAAQWRGRREMPSVVPAMPSAAHCRPPTAAAAASPCLGTRCVHVHVRDGRAVCPLHASLSGHNLGTQRCLKTSRCTVCV